MTFIVMLDLRWLNTVLRAVSGNSRVLRCLDWIFWGGYLPSLSINYVGMSKGMEKWLPQLYYVKMKIEAAMKLRFQSFSFSLKN